MAYYKYDDNYQFQTIVTDKEENTTNIIPDLSKSLKYQHFTGTEWLFDESRYKANKEQRSIEQQNKYLDILIATCDIVTSNAYNYITNNKITELQYKRYLAKRTVANMYLYSDSKSSRDLAKVLLSYEAELRQLDERQYALLVIDLANSYEYFETTFLMLIEYFRTALLANKTLSIETKIEKCKQFRNISFPFTKQDIEEILHV